jgi:hypothetical protein
VFLLISGLIYHSYLLHAWIIAHRLELTGCNWRLDAGSMSCRLRLLRAGEIATRTPARDPMARALASFRDAESTFCVRSQLALEPTCLPGKRYSFIGGLSRRGASALYSNLARLRC